MRRLFRVVALVLPLALSSSVLAWGAVEPPVPQTGALDAVEAQDLVLMPVPTVNQASRTLADDIFKAGLPGTGVAVYFIGRCSQTCHLCVSTTGCPPDDDGTPQACLRYCP